MRRVRQTWGMVIGSTRATAARLGVLTAALLTLAMVRLPRPPTLCLLRGATGIPCPFCGFTTSGACLGHGDLAGALHASPFAVAACAVFVALPVIRRSSLSARWCELPYRSRQVTSLTAIVTALVLSESWQLLRYGVM
jgi:hypothetical protein